MSLENNEQVKSDDNQEHSAKVDNSRRSFAKKSAAIAPVILTLANRSAWSGTNICQSGFASFVADGFVASHMVNVPPNSSNWKTYQDWPSDPLLTDTIKETKLSDYVAHSPVTTPWSDFYPAGSQNGDLTVLQALGHPSNELLRYEVATRLNADLKVYHSVLDQLILLGSSLRYSQFYSSCAG